MMRAIQSSSSSFIMKIILAAIAASFALWGVGDMFRGGISGGYALKAGDVEISLQEYNDELKVRYSTLRQMMGANFTPEMAKQLGIHQQVLNDLQTGLLVRLEAEELGLKVPQSEVLKSMRETVAFQSAGTFSKDNFLQALRQAGISEESYVNSLNKEILSKLILQNFSDYKPDLSATARLLHRLRNETRNVTFYKFTPQINDAELPKADDRALEDYHTRYGEQFRVPEYRKIAWVDLGRDSIAKQFEMENAPLMEIYKERKDSYTQPEKREVSQLLYGTKDEAEQALGLLRQGKSFAETIKVHAPQNELLSLGVVTANALPDEARETVFTLKKDEASPVIETSFGHHIFRVENITAPSVTPFAEVKDTLYKEWSATQIEDAIYEITVELEDSLAAGISLQEAAKDFSLTVQESALMNNKGLNHEATAVGTELSDSLLNAGFKLQDETDSSLVEEKDGAYLLVALSEREESYIPELSDIKPAVTTAWKAKAIRDARREKSLSLASATQTDASKLNSDIFHPIRVNRFKVSGDSPRGITELPPAIRQELFQKPVGAVTNAYLLDAEKGSYLMAKVTKVHKQAEVAANSTNVEVEKIVAELQKQYGENMLSLYLQHLSEKYEIQVNEQAIAQLSR